MVTLRDSYHLGRVEYVNCHVPLSHFSGGERTIGGDAMLAALGARKRTSVSTAIEHG